MPPQLRGRNYTVQIMTNPTPFFVESNRRSSQTSQTIISVRDCGLNFGGARDLRWTVERENAAASIFVNKKTPSRSVRTGVSAAKPTAAGTPQIQIPTSADPIAGKDPVLAVPIQVGHHVSVGTEPESA